MSHYIQALIARREPLAALSAPWPSARVRNLAQGFAILPLTEELETELTERLAAGESVGRCEAEGMLPQLCAWENALACELSRTGPAAYVATNYYAGLGYQSAAVWREGKIVFGFATDRDGETREPINQALRLLGVRAEGEFDEFATIGLAGERSNDGWVSRKG
jgi:hypothetical protein